MLRANLFAVILLVIFSTSLYACGGQSASPAPTLPPAAPTSTPLPPTLPPTPTPSMTATPEPTPIPGVQLVPSSSLGKSIPWLPYNVDKKPMTVFYGFNVRRPPFDNVLVRQAFAAAVDREQIAEQARGYYFRNAAPATTLTHPEVLTRDLYNQVGIPFDPARAKELLRQAGYSDVERFPTVTLLVSTRSKGAPGAYYQMAKTIAAMWQTNLGIQVKVEVLNMDDFRRRVTTAPPDIYQLGWVADYIDPDNFLKALFHSNSEVNFGRFNNQEFDRLVDEAARLTDPEKRLLLYIRAEQILTEEETGIIPLYHCYVPVPYVY